MEPSDNDLIARFKCGDAAAFAALVRRWEQRVYGLAYRMTGNAEDAADVRQVAFLRTYGSLGTLNGRAAFSTWLYQVVLNLCRDRRRALQVRARHTEGMAARCREREGDTSSPVKESEQREISHQIAAAVAGLPQPEREIIVLRHYQDLTFSQIAEVLDTPASTIKSRMTRALGMLRSRLKDVDQ
jgi:RNA polymerase sigma-70 factor (ECF subfamily)